MVVNAGDTILATQYNDNRPNTLGISGTPPSGVRSYLSGDADIIYQIDGSNSVTIRIKDTGAGGNLKTISIESLDGVLNINQLNDDNTLKKNVLNIASSGIPTFSDIPVGPVSNPTTDNQLARKAYVDTKVGLTGAETIAGVKTFSSIPVLPASDPISANEAARKSYIDNSINAKFRSVIVRKTVDQTIVTATDTTLTWDTETDDPDGMHDNVTNNNRLTAPVAGIYLAIVCITWDVTAPAGTNYEVWIRDQGTNIRGKSNASGSTQSQVVSTLVRLALNDWVEVQVHQNSGSNKLIKNFGETNFSLLKVRD